MSCVSVPVAVLDFTEIHRTHAIPFIVILFCSFRSRCSSHIPIDNNEKAAATIRSLHMPMMMSGKSVEQINRNATRAPDADCKPKKRDKNGLFERVARALWSRMK